MTHLFMLIKTKLCQIRLTVNPITYSGKNVSELRECLGGGLGVGGALQIPDHKLIEKLACIRIKIKLLAQSIIQDFSLA